MTQLIFIHGVGGHGKQHQWTAAVNSALEKVGRPPLELQPIAPDYTAILEGDCDHAETSPAPTFERLDGVEREAAQFDYARNAARLRRLADRWPCSPGLVRAASPEVAKTAGLAALGPARTYTADEERRHGVLAAILEHLGSSDDDLVIVAHSLGSVVALDLLYLLPRRATVRLLMTAGSPLAIEGVSAHLQRLEKGFPLGRVKSWVNLVEPFDPVTNGLGLAHRYPDCLDVFIKSGGLNRHGATTYLEQPVVGELLGDALYGPTTTALVLQERLPEAPPTGEQLAFLLRLQYARRLEHALNDDDRRRRTRAARELLLDEVERGLSTYEDASGESGRPIPIPPILNDLRRDLRDRLQGRFGSLEAVTLLLLLAMSRPLDPYDLEFEEDEKRIALRNVLDDLDLKADWADQVLAAIRDAERAHSRGSAAAKRLAGGGAIALGLAAVVAAPFLITPFAVTGVTGAATMTSGLAGIGALVNGGMSAGIATLTTMAATGGLVAAGGTALALNGARSPADAARFNASARLIASATAAEVTATVVQVQALAILRHRLDMSDAQHREWFLLAEIQSAVAEERTRICLLSDPKSATVKEWKQKQKVADQALVWMREKSVAPPELGAADTADAPDSRTVRNLVNNRIRRGRND